MTQAVATPAAGKPRLGRQVRSAWMRDLNVALAETGSVVIAKADRVPTRELNHLRQKLQPMDGSVLVVKNSLCRLTFRNLGWADLEKMVEGTCVVSSIRGDAAAACKLLVQFSKDHEGFHLQGGWLTGQVLKAAELKSIAQLPSRQVLIGQLAGVLVSPMRNLAFLMQAPIRSLALALGAVAKKKGE